MAPRRTALEIEDLVVPLVVDTAAKAQDDPYALLMPRAWSPR